MKFRLFELGLWAAALLPFASVNADHYVLQGAPRPMRHQASRIAVKLKDPSALQDGRVFGVPVSHQFAVDAGILVLEHDALGADPDAAVWEASPDVEFASRVYVGDNGEECVVPPEVIVKFQAGTSDQDTQAYFERNGLEPRVEYPPESGRWLCGVLDHKLRSTLDVANTAYFDPSVVYATPNFLSAPRLLVGDECYNPAYTPPGCNDAMGPGGIDCPPPPACVPPPTCPVCNCTRVPMALPNGPGDDAFADESFQFELNRVWDAWSVTKGHSSVKIFVVDSGLDRDHLDIQGNLELDLNPNNLRTSWTDPAATYSVTLPAQAADPAYVYLYFVSPPHLFISGSEVAFFLNGLEVRVGSPTSEPVRTYSFEDNDSAWVTDFQAVGTTNTFERVAATGAEIPTVGSYILKVKATGAGNPTSQCIRIHIPELQAATQHFVTTRWLPARGGSHPLEGLVRFGIQGDEACNTRFGGEMGGALEQNHGTVVSGLACGADNEPSDYGMTGVAPSCKLFHASAVGNIFTDGTVLLAGARAGASVVNWSLQMAFASDDYYDAVRQIARGGRNGDGAVLVQAAGNNQTFIERDWLARSDLVVSVGGLTLEQPTSGPPTWKKSCTSAYGADVFVYERFNIQVPQSWGWETYGFATLDLVGPDGEIPGDFVHYDEVPLPGFSGFSRRWPTSTSWCTPVVSGIMALILSKDPCLTSGQTPCLSRTEAMQILFHTCRRPDPQGRIEGYSLDCALLDCGVPSGPCAGGVEGGCAPFQSDPEHPDYVNPQTDIPFSAVTGRSKVFGYGLVNAKAAVDAVTAGKRWPEPPRGILAAPGKNAGGSHVVRVSWIPPEDNRYPRGYEGYVLVRSQGCGLAAPLPDGQAPPALGAPWQNGVVVARGLTESAFEDSGAAEGLAFYSLFYYRKLTGPSDYYYSFGAEARIVFSTGARWTTMTSAAALQAALDAGLDSADPTKKVVVFVESAIPIPLSSCLRVGANVRGSETNGWVYLVGDSNPGGVKTTLLPSAGAGSVGINVCGSKYLSISGFTVDGGEVGLGLRANASPSDSCSPTCVPNRADRVYVWNCTFRNQDVGFWLENEGKVFLQNNVVQGLGACTTANCAGVYMPARALDPVDDNRTFYSLLNNTLDVSARPCLRVGMKSLAPEFAEGNVRLQVYNNVLRASGSAGTCVEILTDFHYFLSNHNDFVFLQGASCGRITSPPTSLAGLANWQAVGHSDKSSISADPGFVNPAAADYHLANRLSPCANAGTLEVYDPEFLPVDFDPSRDPRVYSGSFAGGAYASWYLGIDIGADEFKAPLAANDADLGRAFRRGDANNDGFVDLSDAIYISSYLYSGGPAPVCFDAADANDDELLDLSDTIAITRYVYNPSAIAFPGLNTLPEPHPQCGFDIKKLGVPGPQSPSGPLHCGSSTFCSS
jgi:hypothetical protein